MSRGCKDREVGYGRPPKHSQWKKGQCGNPNRIYKRPCKGVVDIIDAQFATPIVIAEGGTRRRVTIFEAILLQLCLKELSGDSRATRVRLKYVEYVRSKASPREVIIEYVCSDDAIDSADPLARKHEFGRL